MVKIECEVCERAEAEVLCCADEAVLCRKCDQRVHAANKLSSRHHRLFLLKLTTSSGSLSSAAASNDLIPSCDRCKGRNGYVFCLEERALLCKTCDESGHMAGLLLSHHQRFLIAGLKVSRDPVVGLGPGTANLTSASSAASSSDFAGQQKEEAPLMSNVGTATTVSVGVGDNNPLEPASSWRLDEIFGTEDFDASDFSVNINSCT